MNQSQIQDPRFRRRWSKSGALGTIDGPIPGDKAMMKWISDENHKHMVQTSSIHYLLEWVPKEILEAEGLSFKNPYDIRSYVALTLFEKIVATPEYVHKLPEGMYGAMTELLEEVDKEGFRTADDYPHPEQQEDEVFISNSHDEGPVDDTGRTDYECIGWKTKRRGVVAYDVNGKVLPEMFPVFVKRSEIEQADPKILKSLLN